MIFVQLVDRLKNLLNPNIPYNFQITLPLEKGLQENLKKKSQQNNLKGKKKTKTVT